MVVWEVQVVIHGSSMRSRPRISSLRDKISNSSSKHRLFALRRRFVVVVDETAVSVKVLGSTTPWWSTSKPKSVTIKKRLVKIIDREERQSIMIRLGTEDKAVDFATEISHAWGIDPLIHSVPVAGRELAQQREQKELERMAAIFMASSEFRARIQCMHAQLEELWTVTM